MDDNKVAVLLEDLQSQFRTFGEGLQLVNNKIDCVEQKVDKLEQKIDNMEFKLDGHIDQNRQEHQQLMQMINELDKEVRVEIKRVK